MIRSPRYRRFGLILLGLAFALACWRVGSRVVRDHASSRITLRFAHWQLEGGIREAFDVIARDYEALHPNVRVEQMTIPVSLYLSWGMSQLVGGEAPDLVEIKGGMGGPEIYTYFIPITEEVAQPNPYNAGTPLAGVPWRNTYADGMDNAYTGALFETYGASVFASTVRIFYNVDLMREITGQTEPPRTFEQFLALGQRVRAHADRTGRPLLPVVCSYGMTMMDDLFRSQTQRLACEMNPGARFPANAGDPTDLYLGYLTRQWTLDHPGIRGGAELMRLMGRELAPGFMQLNREQAVFYFAQGRALMFMGFSSDATGITRQVNFPVRAFRNPSPAPGATGFGANLMGPNAEGALFTYGTLAIPRSSPHPEVALDFLRFLTSQPEDRKFARISGSLPVIVGIEPEGFAKDLMPDGRGFPSGPTFTLGETGRVFAKNLNLLFGPHGSSDTFLGALGRDLSGSMRADLENTARQNRRTVALNDTSIEAVHRLLTSGAPSAALQRKYQGLVETQNELEATACYIELRLRQAERRK
jgi:raffinose/stachyose/melibiose transport system substrate-binding protein